MIAFLTFPKPFCGDIKRMQYNALQSWKALDPAVEIYLAGEVEGDQDAVRKLNVKHLPEVKKNRFGTPLLNSGLKVFLDETRLKMRCVINCDIILGFDFKTAVQSIPLDSFLGIGQRWDIDFPMSLDFSNRNWEESFWKFASHRVVAHQPSGMDYFLFTEHTHFGEIPDFAIGRASWDNWFVFNAVRRNIPVVDLSPSVRAIHQNHDYSHVPERRGNRYLGTESDENRRLRGAMLGSFGIKDADYQLIEAKIIPFSFEKRLEILLRVYKSEQLRRLSLIEGGVQ